MHMCGNSHNRTYFIILKTFGISRKMFVPAEKTDDGAFLANVEFIHYN